MKLPVSLNPWKCIVASGTLCALAFSLAGSVLAAPASEKAADRFGWKFEYDDADRVTRVTDPAGRDTRLQYSFDGAKRLRKMIRVRADEPSVAREFDESGRLKSMTDGAGKVSYGYDERGRLNRVQRQGTAAVAYAYDTQDRVTRLQVGDFYRVEYSYDFLGRLAAMKTPAGEIQYEYHTGQGKVVRTLPNGVKTIWEYEPNGRLRQITHADGKNALLAEYTYDYRPDGLIKAIRERSQSGQFVKAYEYDLVGRLIKASGPAGQQYAYEYDAVGNRTRAVATGKPAQTYAYDWGGRLAAVDGKPTEHDAAGNLTSLTIAGSTLKYRHNQDGQLAEVLDGKVSYRYDGDGNLIGRKAGGVEASFVPDPLASIWRPLVTAGKGGQRTLIVWDGSTPLMAIRDGKAESLLHDHLGSVRLLVEGQGKVTRQIDYEPFGAPDNTATLPDGTAAYAGLFWDHFGGLYLARARAYAPQLGRFLQVDPVQRVPAASQERLSGYVWCGGDAVNCLDRDGAEATTPSPMRVNPVSLQNNNPTDREVLEFYFAHPNNKLLGFADELDFRYPSNWQPNKFTFLVSYDSGLYIS
jgi:RHS repeat-associated protein